MTTVVSIANEKGGVGKTDLAVNLASCIAQQGKRTLLIDLDPQANASRYILDGEVEQTSADLLMNSIISIYHLAIETGIDGLHIIPASKALSAAQLQLAADPDMQFRLKRKLRFLTGYDVILIDTPPSLGVLTINALTASNFVLIPLQAQFLPLYGITDLMDTIEKLKLEINPELEFLGLVLTLYDKRTKIAKEIEGFVKEKFGRKLFDAKIPSLIM